LWKNAHKGIAGENASPKVMKSCERGEVDYANGKRTQRLTKARKKQNKKFNQERDNNFGKSKKGKNAKHRNN